MAAPRAGGLAGAGLAGVVLAAGLGTRLRPLTSLRPKPLCPVGSSTSLHRALDLLAPHCGTGSQHLACTAFHLADQVVAAAHDQAHVQVEPQLLGTAGGLANLARWRAGRDVLLVNGDAYLAPPQGGRTDEILAALVHDWDRVTVRMLVVEQHDPADFVDHRGSWRYVGACVLPADLLEPLRAEPGGLYRQVWEPARDAGRFELVPHLGTAVDTGTPAGYLAANLHASGGVSAIGPGAQVHGRLERCVVWPGAWVGADETLTDAIRAGDRRRPVTVLAGD